ncbi:MBL fold metallo-hydrolase [Roseivirga misakiensis]|uniref:MBL fold metallo-hydrolase n=1 Tax=Roseivirga misakiensis TaxID=1563681 RepID=A0A1E5T6Y6_9BACT|nr:MBL fold metallo-hydrolase [Roseivirga misakiensis]OEK07155.1 MBL fold metallo-hydrolase [Roseivirga misakiensis]
MTNRRSFIKQSTALSALSLLPSSFLYESLFQNGYKMQALRNNVGIFSERGGTIGWMISDDGLVVVDSQFPPQAEHMVQEIRKQSDRKIDLLVNTHHHGDHSAGNIAFKGIVEKVMAHENSLKNQKANAERANSVDKQLFPDTTYKKGKFSEKVGKEKVSLHYFGAAHTDGDSFVHFENANIVHCGDLVFNRRAPFVDKSAGANMENWQRVMERGYKAFDKDTLFVFGHSGSGYEVTGTRDDLRAFQNYLAKVMEFVKKGAAAGKTKEELAAATEIPGAPEWKGRQTRPVNAAWTELFDEK